VIKGCSGDAISGVEETLRDSLKMSEISGACVLGLALIRNKYDIPGARRCIAR